MCLAITSLRGSIVALVTPMITSSNEIDVRALEALVRWHVSEGTKGIVAVGTTGESPTLDEAEWEIVVTTCIATAKGSLPVIAGTGSNNTLQTMKKTRKAKELGAAAALVVTPYYNKPTQEGLYQHYKKVSEAVPDFPIILYNVPGRTGCDMLPETVERLSKFPNVVGTKEASGKLERFAELRKRCGPNFKVYSGEDFQACESILSHGSDGVISVTANIMPQLMTRMCEAALEGDSQKSKELDSHLASLHDLLFVEPNPTAAKWLLYDLKSIQGGIRLPLLPLSGSFHSSLRDAYVKARSGDTGVSPPSEKKSRKRQKKEKAVSNK